METQYEEFIKLRNNLEKSLQDFYKGSLKFYAPLSHEWVKDQVEDYISDYLDHILFMSKYGYKE